MARLILTFDGSAAGVLKGTRLADCVIAFEQGFVWGRLQPPSLCKTLRSPRPAKHIAPDSHWLDGLAGARVEEAREQGLGLAEFCERFDGVELWADPEPNAQLQLVWLLDHLRPHANAFPGLPWCRPVS